MTFYSTISVVPNTVPVTVADYLTKEIYADRETPDQIINGNDKRFHLFLKNLRVYGIDIGSENDLIILVQE